MILRLLSARWAPLAAFVILAICGWFAINGSAHKTARQDALIVWHAQRDACVRGNNLRRESNARIAAHEADKENLIGFLEAAEVARRHAGTPLDIRAANKYRAYIKKERRTVKFRAMPLVDCAKAVPKP